MAGSQAYRFLWSVGIVVVLLPHLYTGLLSDYKICADSECVGLLSRVQAIRDHRGKDCRYLSFKRGDTIFVYHKLTGKREDLWAGTIDKQFGYFPKDAVREERLYATVARVVETQKSDFFCMDEFGYPIDSSHLDSGEDEDDDGVQNQEPETTQTPPHLDDKNTESPSTPEVVSSESQGSADGTQEELDKNSNADAAAAAGTQEEAPQDPAASKEQGGSASSPWLGSTVTGWLGLAEEEESANVAEGEKKDAGEETPAEASSLAASLTGWLGMGEGGGEPDDGVESRKEEEAESPSSPMTGWLGFGGEQTAENSAEQEDVNKKREEQEPAETFRSRRMSLDLEGSQLQKEEEEVGTLGWLGNGLSSTLGFGQGNQESETAEREAEETVKAEESGSWYDLGMGTIFGFEKDKSEESTEREAEADKPLDQPTGTESKAADQPQHAQTEDLTVKTNDESNVEVTPQDEEIPSEADTVPDTERENSDDEDASKRSEESVEAAEGMSLKPDNLVQTEDKEEGKESLFEEDEKEKNVPDLETAAMEGKVNLASEAIENEGDDKDRQTREEEIKTTDESDQDILVQPDTDNTSDLSSLDFTSESAGRPLAGVEESENLVQESAKIQSQTYESADTSDQINARGDGHEGDMNNQEAGVLQREISEAETDVSVEQSQTGTEKSSVEIHDPNYNVLENTAHQDSVSSDKQERVNQSDEDAQEQREVIKGSEKDEENSLLTSTVDSELETEEDKESKQYKEEREGEELKTEEKLVERTEIEAQEDEEEQDEVRDVKKEMTKKEELLESEELKEERTEEETEVTKGEEIVLEELKENTQEEFGESKEEGELEKVEEKQLEEVKQEVEELKEGEHTEFKELKEEDEKEKRDQVPSLHAEQETENNDRPDSESKETQDENRLETSNQSEEDPQIGEHKDEENKETELMDEVEDVGERAEGERGDREEEGEDARGRDEKNREASQTVSYENKRDEDRTKEERVREEERHDDAETDERNEQNEEDKIPDALGVDQVEEIEYTNNDLPHVVEDIQGGLSREVSPSQTAEVEGNDQIETTKLNSNKGISTEEKTETYGYIWEEGELNMKQDNESVNEDDDVMMTISYQNTSGTEITTEGEVFTSEAFESQAVASDQTVPPQSAASSLPPQGPDNGEAKTEGGSTFGLFKNAFNFFGQTPAADTEESTESPESLDSNTHETPEVQTTLTPEQPDTPADSSQGYIQELHSDTPVPLSEQHHPSPSPTQTPEFYPSAASPNRESPFHVKTVSKQYKNLHTFLSADDTVMLGDLFGRHKLQFLDDILGSQETMTGDPDTDESILLDVEVLLHHHREGLTTPRAKLLDAPQEDKGKTRMLIALQKLEMLLAKVRETFSSSNTNHQDTAESGCVGESCSISSKDKEMAAEGESHKVVDSSADMETNIPKDEWMGLDKENGGKLRGDTDKQSVDEVKERASLESHPHSQPEPSQALEAPGLPQQILEGSIIYVLVARELLIWLTVQVVSALPDDIRPGPDLYGVPWEPVIFSSLVGLLIMLLFTCRCYSSVKSRLYRSRERWMAEQVAQLLDEKCKVLETLSKCQQEFDDLETSLTDSGVLAQAQKTEQLEVKARQLGQDKKELNRDLKQLKDQVDQQREHREEQERRIGELEESMKTLEEETKDLQSQEEQAHTTLKVYNMNSERLQRNLETAGEENNLLQDSNAQLRQQVEGWAERVGELEAEISRCEVAHSGMLQDVTNKDERILSLTDRLLSMKAWDSDLKEEAGGEGGKETSNGTGMKGDKNGRGGRTDSQGHLQKVQKLIYAAKLNADLKSVDEDKDRAFAKLNDEIKAKEDLFVSIKEMENEKLSLQSDTENYSEQVQKLQQKLHIMTEMYQDNELKLHRLLTVEEKDRMQKEERLNKADKNIALALEELNNYRQRAGEMEEELEKTKQSYQTQISAHEKKAHNNWLAARAAERDLSDIRRENALLRQKLTDTQFKLDTLDKDLYALDSLARPLPFRAERSPYGPSPLGRPGSETRPFLSPPTLMDGPPARLSPRVPRGPMEHLGGPGDMERPGGTHSDSGSISPSWERDRRGPPPGPPGPPGPQGYMFPEPGGPIYRRPPGPMGPFPPGPLPPRGLPPGPYHPADMADGSFRENSFGPGEQDHRESGPADRRTSPEADPRIGGPPPPGPPMGPMDGPFPRRAPFGPPPPDFYPPRSLGGPPIRPMWAPPPPGMMLPPRFPPGGPLPPHPHQAPHMRHPFPDSHPPPSMGPPPPRQPLPSPPSSQSPEEHTPSPEDAI